MISCGITTPFINKRLHSADWKRLQTDHRNRVSKKIDDYLDQRQHQQKDPVMDFLFEYYAFRPSHLKRWSPGFGVLLQGGPDTNYPELSELTCSTEGVFLNPDFFPDDRKSSLHWMLGLLEHSREKRPSFGCFGMHEWAMVYRRDKIRHSQVPLRMEQEELAEFVESRPLVCTHYDAFRFFSEPAKPLNKYKLSRDIFSESEQPGCIHTNMDLYKWAFKGYPWISSEVIWKAFELAVEARFIDMQASPYDFRERGLEPIKIETEGGRLKYLEKQKAIYNKGVPVREHLIREYQQLVNHFRL